MANIQLVSVKKLAPTRYQVTISDPNQNGKTYTVTYNPYNGKASLLASFVAVISADVAKMNDENTVTNIIKDHLEAFDTIDLGVEV